VFLNLFQYYFTELSARYQLLSNAVIHAFPNKCEGEISIQLCEAENYKQYLKKSGDFRADSKCQNEKHFQYVLTIKDNGIGIPKNIDFGKTTSLRLQIVNLLVEQIEGCIELETNKGTKFIYGLAILVLNQPLADDSISSL
jgi:two-component sensor histidine kinase